MENIINLKEEFDALADIIEDTRLLMEHQIRAHFVKANERMEAMFEEHHAKMRELISEIKG